MGLTIHYDFQLRTKSVDKIKALLEKLRQKALDLPFAHVDKAVMHLTPDICAKPLEFYRGKRGVQHQPKYKQKIFQALMDASTYVPLPWARMRQASVHVQPVEAFAFNTWPGPGCESAGFGLSRYPLEIEVGYRLEDDDKYTKVIKNGGSTRWEFNYDKWRRHVHRIREAMPMADRIRGPFVHEYRDVVKRKVKTRLGGCWRFGSFCKTQYASDPNCGGIGHFIRCHLCVIRMLEYAQELGIEVGIDDEGHFGPAHYSDDHREARAAGREPTYIDHLATHSLKTLVKEVGDYNVLVAGMAGMMRDAAGAKGLEMESPIFQYQNFEHLEADFHVGKAGDFDEVIKSFATMANKEVAEAKAKAEAAKKTA